MPRSPSESRKLPGVVSAIPLVEGQALASGTDSIERRPGPRHPRGRTCRRSAASPTTSSSARSTDFDAVERGRDRHAAGQRARPHHRQRSHAGDAARQRHAVRRDAADQGLSGRRDLRDRHVGIRFDLRLHAVQRGAGLFQPRRRGERDRDLSRQRRPRRRAAAGDRAGRRPPDPAHRLAAARTRRSSRRSRSSGTSCS